MSWRNSVAKNILNLPFRKIALVVICLCWTSMAAAQPDEEHTDAEVPAVMLDEILVTEIRSPRLWRLNIERAEDGVYDLFNRLIENSDYKVDCRREGTMQSRILVRTCEPRFVTRRRALNTRNMIVDWRSDDEDQIRGMENAINNKYVDERDLQHDLADKYEEMNQAMLQLALENPELMRALERLGALRAAYQNTVAAP